MQIWSCAQSRLGLGAYRPQKYFILFLNIFGTCLFSQVVYIRNIRKFAEVIFQPRRHGPVRSQSSIGAFVEYKKKYFSVQKYQSLCELLLNSASVGIPGVFRDPRGMHQSSILKEGNICLLENSIYISSVVLGPIRAYHTSRESYPCCAL